MKSKIIVVLLGLAIFLTAYAFENVYLMLNGALHNSGTYKGNFSIPHYVLTFSEQQIFYFKAAANVLQFSLNVIFGFIMVTILNDNKETKFIYLGLTGVVCFLLSATYALLKWLLPEDSQFIYHTLTINIIRSPIFYLTIVLVIISFEKDLVSFLKKHNRL